MLLYRVEHPEDGQGPFNSDHVRYTNAYNRWRNVANRLPPVREDGHCMESEERCACLDLGTLVKWFGTGARMLARQGFVVKVLEVESAVVGKSRLQAFYTHGNARIIDTLPIGTALKLGRKQTQEYAA